MNWEGEVTVKLATSKALLIVYEGEEVWIPLSLVDDDSEVYRAGQSGTLVIPYWLAEEKGLEG